MGKFILILSILALLSIFSGIGAPLFVGFFGGGVALIFWIFLFIFGIILVIGKRASKKESSFKKK